MPLSLPEELATLLSTKISLPSSLQHLCRWNLLQCLKPRAHVKVPLLGLPERLQKYLLLDDLVELNRAFAHRLKPNPEDFCRWHQEDMSDSINQCPSIVCECDPSGLGFVCI